MKKTLKIAITCEVETDKNLLEINEQVQKQFIESNFVIGLGGAGNIFELDLADITGETAGGGIEWTGDNLEEIQDRFYDCDVENDDGMLIITKISSESYSVGEFIPGNNPTGE